MPYYITDKNADCSGWAVVDAADAVFGCHQTKQGAIDQAIAVSLADDEPFVGKRAAIDSLEPGDYVSWNPLDPEILAEIVMVEGELAVVKLYDFEDGVFEPSDKLMIVNIFKLEIVPRPEFVVEPELPDMPVAPVMDAAVRKADGDPIILSDIDGTLLNGGNRNQRVWDYIQSLDGALFILTGRPESDRANTEHDLAAADITYSRLIMNDGSMADSPAFKKAKAEELLQTYNIVAAVENNAATLSKFRELGIDAVSPASLRWSGAAAAIVAKLEPQVVRDAGDWALLTERQQTQAQDTAELATEFGMFNQGSGADGAHYFEQNPFAAEGVKCGNCIFFNAERSQCQVVEGTIDSEAVCKLWVIPEADLGASDNLEPMGANRSKWLDIAYRLISQIEGEPVEGRAKPAHEQRVNVANFEVRETPSGMAFSGYAAVFNSDSVPLPFIERVAPGAFKRSLQSRNEVKLLWNHDSGEPLASVRGGTLKLVEDAHGLRVDAQLANTTRGRDVAELIRSKTIDSMSFGFSVIKDSWSADGGLRTLDAVRLFEVSIVSSPAYESTAGTIAVRSATGIDADQLADALMRLESGDELETDQASLINDVVAKLTKTDAVQEVQGDILALKKKKLDMLMKEI